MTDHPHSPPGWPPAAVTVALVGTVHDDGVVATLRFTDGGGVQQRVVVSPGVALDLLVQLGLFLQQIGVER